jgi:hypothetical protein
VITGSLGATLEERRGEGAPGAGLEARGPIAPLGWTREREVRELGAACPGR